MYGLPDDFALPSFRGPRLVQVAIGQHQRQLDFAGDNRSVCIESSYSVEDFSARPDSRSGRGMRWA